MEFYGKRRERRSKNAYRVLNLREKIDLLKGIVAWLGLPSGKNK
jgi:5'-3' exonuclease